MQSALTFFYNLTAGMGFASYGLAIILLTIAIKAILYPLTVKQVKSMKAMQEIQPKMKELQEKYKGNPEKLNKELAILYKEAGVNPLAGCLPLLVQMPFLISIFFAIRDYHYVQQPPSFLWMTDLAQPDHTYILPVLSALTTYIQQKQTTSEMNQQAKMMMVFMPLFIGYISLNFPGGLVLYWVVSNLFQIGQQWFMYRNDPAVVRKEAR
ncbi:YidC/Oxa1 family membrane protein insertase [Sporomusa carbonis]|uniref:YidC/Oxa1 family membrane protein insertase n=1 Tax=Sporomusa carbonis TaxID=3076075 RepID=UPI003C7AF752